MADLPSGIVTFLFTDIEGSTPLWERDPDAMRQSLMLHNAILEDAIAMHNGVVFKLVGDAFNVAFHYPTQAFQAAVEIQRELSAATWGATGELRVRVGLHTGPAEVQGSEYISHTLNRVSRVMSAAHGGQILLTGAVAELIRGQLTDGASLRDMGQHHLKGMMQPEHLFQVVASDLQAVFPPLNVFDPSPHNLPLELTSFVGREKEIEAVDQLMREARLVTLTGSGGVGKTRLAIEIGRRAIPVYSEGVWLVELAPLTDPQLVLQALSDAVGLRDSQDRPLMEVLTAHLQAKRSLLIFDNCEHLIDACARTVASLLHACPRLTVLASSREALGLAGEQIFQVPNLSLPGDEEISLDKIVKTEALQLFVQRAQTAMHGFQLTRDNIALAAQICRRLDGIPLAIELAAARVKTLRIEQIAQRLDDRFRLLTGGSRTSLPRQQTLRATIDWSYELLSQAERRQLERLSVFSGGCTLEAAEAICTGEEIQDFEILDLLTGLVNKSMVVVDREQDREPRFRLLETVRQYAREKLFESDSIVAYRDRHLRYFMEWAEMAEPKTREAEQAYWLERMEEEYENLSAALEWARERDPGSGLRLTNALGYFWWIRNKHQEGVRWLTYFIDIAMGENSSQNPRIQARSIQRGYALGWLAFILMISIDPSRAFELALESLAINREAGDQTGESFMLYILGYISLRWKYDLAAARSYLDEGLSVTQSSGNQLILAIILYTLGVLEGVLGHKLSQRDYLERSLAISRQVGDQMRIASALEILTDVKGSVECDLQGSRKMVEEVIEIYHQLKATSVIDDALFLYGHILCWQGEYPYARAIFQELEEIQRQGGDPIIIIASKRNFGFVDMLEGKNDQAIVVFEDCLAQLKKSELNWNITQGYLTNLLTELGIVLTRTGETTRAKSCLEEALAKATNPLDRAMALQGLGLVESAQGDGRSAAEYYLQSLQILQESSYRFYAISALEDYAGAIHLLAQDTKAIRILGTMVAVRHQIGAPLPPGDQPRQELLLADLKAQLGETGFDQAWDGSQAMTLDEALAFALEP
jgi:predicted ATPase/class 3 adenylate cyclase